ncbi:hypothetical protein [Microbacterium sp. XT11]|uniref:hypothetical protein n=1 Tax=Microbacterium sp. XT11 TaxID=367477 RepID=UPI0009F9D0F4|nr:hypothetical protein [Microbacterium sp. XT11]
MTDPQLPPSGALPPVPPAPQPPAAQPPAPQYPGYAQAPGTTPSPSVQPAYAPTVQTPPPGAYQVPVGGYPAPSGGYAVPEPGKPTGSGMFGVLAFVFGLIAGIVAPIVIGFLGVEIGTRIPAGIDAGNTDRLLEVLSPARDQVLWAEITFWIATVLGIAAIVLGILSIRARRSRGLGITGLVLAVLGPLLYGVVLLFAVPLGTAMGFAR